MWDLVSRDERVNRVPPDAEQDGNLRHVEHVAFVDELLGYAASVCAVQGERRHSVLPKNEDIGPLSSPLISESIDACTLQGTRTGSNYDGGDRNLARFFYRSRLARLADARGRVEAQRGRKNRSAWNHSNAGRGASLTRPRLRGIARCRFETGDHFAAVFMVADIRVAIRAVAISKSDASARA
jgi:hypothetical protein